MKLSCKVALWWHTQSPQVNYRWWVITSSQSGFTDYDKSLSLGSGLWHVKTVLFPQFSCELNTGLKMKFY